MKRRRFLQIFAATVATGGPSAANQDWIGQGFGADLKVTFAGDGDRGAVIAALPDLIRQIEDEFSLYDSKSSLSRLNRESRLDASPMFLELIETASALHDLSDGVFDPTVQGIWEQRTGLRQSATMGWHNLSRVGSVLSLPSEACLTFNGIAQGYAADCVKKLLAENGFTNALIDMGEQNAIGGPWEIGVADPVFGLLAQRRLSNRALATSSSLATLVAGEPHLIHPAGHSPLWSTVSIEAKDAVFADGISTAAVFFTIEKLKELLTRTQQIDRIVLVDFDGNLQSLTS